MRQFISITAVLLSVALGGAWVSAQTAAPPKVGPPPAAAHTHPGATDSAGPTTGNTGMGMGMMGGGGMAMGMGMMGGLCPMAMGGADTKVEVKNTPKGVTITLTSTDPSRVARLQKMAEAMRLMHEATAP